MSKAWQAQILTLFPEMFPGVLGASLAGKALKDGLWSLETLDIRQFAGNKHASVDDTPYGGGAGMVMRPDVVDAAIKGAEAKFGKAARKIYLSPRGRVLDQDLVKELAHASPLLLLCGRYEGVDQRVIEANALEEVSLGDFVLAGGEVAAMTLIEACTRLLPGVMGNAATVDEESFESGLLEYPHYTRPADWNGLKVPDVLMSGHHEKVRAWRQTEAETITATRRPDLWNRYQTEQKKKGLKESNMNLLQKLEQKNLDKLKETAKVAEFSIGDTVRVNVKVIEGTRERVQAYEGVCIARKSAGVNSSFTVRKISYGEGVERVFPLYSPRLESIELVRRGAVRRAKLYYLRGLRGKSARITERTDYEANTAAAAPKKAAAEEKKSA